MRIKSIYRLFRFNSTGDFRVKYKQYEKKQKSLPSIVLTLNLTNNLQINQVKHFTLECLVKYMTLEQF